MDSGEHYSARAMLESGIPNCPESCGGSPSPGELSSWVSPVSVEGILRAKGGECDVTSVHREEHGTPTTPKHQRVVCSCKAATYVIAASDFIRSAGSTGEFASVGFSRTLEGVESTATNWGAYQRTISKTGNAPWSLLCQAPRRQYHYRNRLHTEEVPFSMLRVLRNLEQFISDLSMPV